ncbi:SPOR domain-containing protein [Nioella aestuarii]|uniref:SPOR domain-containing protein n=1 Tax=Nioella aestuarii TaxID=1662864 RepID=UPI003D7F2E35
MYLLRAVSGLAVAAVVAVPVSAQSIAQLGGPAETPPASYSSDQYVDSRGCVFIRAGYGGQETWVPRVTRDRQPLCGYEPSVGGSAPVAVAAAPEPVVEEPPVEIVVAPAAPSTPVVQPQPAAPAAVAVASPAPAPAAPATRPVPQQPAVSVVSCQGLPAGAAQYMQGSGVRCGPQAIHPADGQPVLRMAGAASPSRRLELAPVVIPEGYRQAWTDGRLNAARGLPYATPEGDAAMAQIWSETLPRVAVDPAADGVAVSRVASSPASDPVVTRASSTPNIAAGDSMSEAAAATVPSGHRYVEIARYADRATADAARLRLQQQGMATMLGGIAQSSGGYGSYVVLAGPFEDAQTLGRTLSAAHGLGYSGAVTR